VHFGTFLHQTHDFLIYGCISYAHMCINDKEKVKLYCSRYYLEVQRLYQCRQPPASTVHATATTSAPDIRLVCLENLTKGNIKAAIPCRHHMWSTCCAQLRQVSSIRRAKYPTCRAAISKCVSIW
jgi:hypothetical protein